MGSSGVPRARAVAERLAAAGVRTGRPSGRRMRTGSCGSSSGPARSGRRHRPPAPRGPRLPGLPADADGFVPVDPHARVRGIERVWAVGDMTNWPLKQGGLAAQQADVAAARHRRAGRGRGRARRAVPARGCRASSSPARTRCSWSASPGAPATSEASVCVPVVARAQGCRASPRPRILESLGRAAARSDPGGIGSRTLVLLHGGARLRRLLDVGRSLLEELDPDVVLDRLLEVAQELTGARYAAIGVLDERREVLEQFITRGIDEETHRAIGDLPHGRGVLGVLIHDPNRCGCRTSARIRSRTASRWPIRRCTRSSASRSSSTAKCGGTCTSPRRTAASSRRTTRTRSPSSRTGRRSRSRTPACTATFASGVTSCSERTAGLETTTEIARALGGLTDVDRVLELVVKRSRALISARAAELALVDGDDLVVAAVAGQGVDAAARRAASRRALDRRGGVSGAARHGASATCRRSRASPSARSTRGPRSSRRWCSATGRSAS